MNHARLEKALREFDPTDAELRVVVRQAVDLADAEQFQEDAGYLLTPDVVVRNLRDAPDDTLAERWNWWLGSLEAAYGGYRRFQVRYVERDPEEHESGREWDR